MLNMYMFLRISSIAWMVVFNPVLLGITLFKTQQRPYRIAYPFGVAKSLQMIMRRF